MDQSPGQPHYGWFVGWAGLMAFIPGFTGLNLGLAPILSERLGLSLSETSILVVVVVLGERLTYG